jgi:hypothetical protein
MGSSRGVQVPCGSDDRNHKPKATASSPGRFRHEWPSTWTSIAFLRPSPARRADGQGARRITDKKVLKLIRSYLEAGVTADGVKRPSEEGTPQGSPLSPLLSDVYLDDLDRMLEKRGHRFVRYADDITIYVASKRAA